MYYLKRILQMALLCNESSKKTHQDDMLVSWTLFLSLRSLPMSS